MKRAWAFIRRFTGALLLLAASLSQTGCGGAVVGLLAGGGIGGTGFSTGVLLAFGSVIVNGVEYQTDDNTIRRLLDDPTFDPTGLPDNAVFRVGMVVRVHYVAGDNDALQIDYQNDLEGPVANLDAGARTFTVLGQPVVFNDNTNFLVEPGAAFVDNAIVEISGLYGANGTLYATFIHVEPSDKTLFEIKGFVSALDNQALTFGLGPAPGVATVTVSYAGADLSDLPSGLANGLYVEVKTLSTSGTLVAESIEEETSIADDAPDEGEAEIEGFVANLAGSSPEFTFLLNGVQVRTNAATRGLENVSLNAHVEAEGTLSNGVLIAEKIDSR